MLIPLILLVIVLTLILILLQQFSVIYLKELLLPGICMLFVLCLVLMSGTVLTAAKSGLMLWSYVIIPSLFPFLVAAEIINATGFVRTSGVLLEPLMRPLFNVPGSASFALAMGIVSGYPVGAKITTDLRSNGSLTKIEAERLLAFTNNSGPLFIIGAVGATMYKSTAIGIYLFACHLAACLSVGVIFSLYKRKRSVRNVPAAPAAKIVPPKRNVPPVTSGRNVPPINPFRAFGRELKKQASIGRPSFAVILGDAVKSSVASILTIGGFVVLFSVIIQILSDIGSINLLVSLFSNLMLPFGVSEDVLRGLISGLFEITTGSGLVSGAKSVSPVVKLPAASFIIGWAGLSVHSQVMSIISKTDICIRPYLFGKFLQGFLAALYTWAGMRLFNDIPNGTIENTGIIEGTVLASDSLSAAGTTAGAVQSGLSAFIDTAEKSFLLLAAVTVFFCILSLLSRLRRPSDRDHKITL